MWKKRNCLILVLGLCAWGDLFAKDYSAGFQEYLRANFQQSKEIFVDLLAAHPSADEKKALYKMKGLCEFMQGDRAAAAKSFEKAKAIDPTLQLSSQEILDQSVLDFFASITVRSPKRAPSIEKKKPEPVAPHEEVPAAWLEKPAPAPVIQPPPVATSPEVAAPPHVVSEQEHAPLPHMAYYFLPFGVGQYLNHTYGLGIASTVTQIVTLSLGGYYYNSATTIVGKTNGEVTDREHYANTHFSDPVAQKAYYQTQVLDYQSEQTKKSDAAYNTSYIMLGVFASVWISSVVEALLSRSHHAHNSNEAPSNLSDEEQQYFSLQLRPNPRTLSFSGGTMTWTVYF